MRRAFLSLAVLLLLCGCPRNCPDDQVAGLVVSARHANSGTPLNNPTIRITDGDYQETLVAQDVNGFLFAGAINRPGVYTITVQMNGFKTVTVQNVNVPATFCSVQTQTVSVNLPPL
jgi:hypothetical protein